VWETTKVTTTKTSDETVQIPVITKDSGEQDPSIFYSADDVQMSEAEYIRNARNKGVTIGALIVIGIIIICACGVAAGSALTRILVL